MKYPLASTIVILIALAACLALRAEEPTKAYVEKENEMSFNTSVRRQMAKAGILKAYRLAKEVTVQLVWSDSEAAPDGKIAEEKIQSKSEKLELSVTQKELLFKVLSVDKDYKESRAPCLCEFQPQLRIVFQSGTPEVRYDILLSGISHGEIQAFRAKEMKAYARTSNFVPVSLDFLDEMFPKHELTKMLHQFQENRGRTSVD